LLGSGRDSGGGRFEAPGARGVFRPVRPASGLAAVKGREDARSVSSGAGGAGGGRVRCSRSRMRSGGGSGSETNKIGSVARDLIVRSVVAGGARDPAPHRGVFLGHADRVPGVAPRVRRDPVAGAG
jgi:hypothetical protein